MIAIELTTTEAKILIAVLVFAEGAALESSPAITEALKDLRGWRRLLLYTYHRSQVPEDA